MRASTHPSTIPGPLSLPVDCTSLRNLFEHGRSIRHRRHRHPLPPRRAKGHHTPCRCPHRPHSCPEYSITSAGPISKQQTPPACCRLTPPPSSPFTLAPPAISRHSVSADAQALRDGVMPSARSRSSSEACAAYVRQLDGGLWVCFPRHAARGLQPGTSSVPGLNAPVYRDAAALTHDFVSARQLIKVTATCPPPP
ncbi:hypothetical protein HYPSUDRAFT_321381 [Hypholoma sublateritium FD-334 SS-4]|uniref:Uncharacterized protein n=1 Tax=Hypholoma sublateritium (strain FD-334 SS-4) TaxID=945553 RepID=A0A0D2P6V5_HYPSF|nr:hypothetical protein HYPSUDRAFT_321381 [Hypholoma sublateritium FD-334 SS-4]